MPVIIDGTTGVDTIQNGIVTSAKIASGQTPSFNGIQFPATQAASADANTLDDYEEGTFTPTDVSGAGLTFGAATSARYVKIGKRVFCDLEVIFPATSNTNLATIGNFPFQASGDANYSSCSVMNDANLNAWAFMGIASSFITVYKQNSTFTQVLNVEFSGKALYFSLSYDAVN